MEKYQRDFIDVILRSGALLFKEITLKSGRMSPYFFNLGGVNNNRDVQLISFSFAETIRESGVPITHLFGPAYKGTYLLAGVGNALFYFGIEVFLSSNRKEAKTHGEGGSIVGAIPNGESVGVFDDVITNGATKRQGNEIIRSHGGTPTLLVVGLDRLERVTDDVDAPSALDQFAKEECVHARAIVDTLDVVDRLREIGGYDGQVRQVLQYLHRYGTTEVLKRLQSDYA